MNVFRKSIFFLFIVTSFPLIAMEKKEEQSPSALFSSECSVLQDITKAMDAVPSGGYVGVDNPFLTNQAVIKALQKLPAKKVKTVVNLSSRSEHVAQQLRKHNVTVNIVPGLHAKRCVISHTDPKKENKPVNGTVFVGSHNMSNLAPNHHEVMVKSDNSEEVKQHLKDHQFVCSLANKNSVKGVASPKKVVKTTPVRPKVFNSRKMNANKSKIQRVKKLFDSVDEHDCIELTSMTFDSAEIAKVLADLKKERKEKIAVRCIFDRAALKHDDLLQQLHDAGAQIFIFNAEGDKKIWDKYPKLQHTKTLLRKCDGKCLVVTSTGNLTKQSNREINVDTYHPSDEQLFDHMKAFNDKLAQQSVAYKELLKSKVVKRKRDRKEEKKEAAKTCVKRSKNSDT